jgi:hypothetical protein
MRKGEINQSGARGPCVTSLNARNCHLKTILMNINENLETLHYGIIIFVAAAGIARFGIDTHECNFERRSKSVAIKLTHPFSRGGFDFTSILMEIVLLFKS